MLFSQGRVELELELIPKDEADANPVGERRDEPQALAKPKYYCFYLFYFFALTLFSFEKKKMEFP